MKRAVITGVFGQDGAYLADLLLQKGYQVYGTYRRTSSPNPWRLDELGIRAHPKLTLTVSDVTDPSACIRLLQSARPHEVYNLAAQSFVGTSFDQPCVTTQIDGLGALHLLEAIRIVNRDVRFYQASSAEMFGLVQAVPQTETTPFYPRSPYAVAKLYGHWMAINYRESYNIFASCGILFNHESPLRGVEFVTRKIAVAVARIALGEDHVLELGNLDAQRDWGYAKEYVEGMWRMLQAPRPDTFVFATRRNESVRSFVTMAFSVVGIDLVWHGSAETERAVCARTSKEVVRVSPSFFRPAEVDALLGDFSKAEQQLGWRPRTNLSELCAMMVEADLNRQRKLKGVGLILPSGFARKSFRASGRAAESAVNGRPAAAVVTLASNGDGLAEPIRYLPHAAGADPVAACLPISNGISHDVPVKKRAANKRSMNGQDLLVSR